ncbi:MAG: FxsA family protein [Actinobacteria bacterium]|nr:FxsA family protein [Actinomycetota bacterium]
MALVLLALVALFLVEISVMVAVANATNVAVMFLALIVLCAAGAWLVKRQGLATWKRVNEGFARGEMPTNALLDGFIWVIAGALLLVPGFVSDLLAVALILPPTRALLRPVIVHRLERRAGASVRTASASFTTFGFGTSAGGFGATRPGGFEDPLSGVRRRRDDDIIDLDSEEMYLDEPRGEIGPGAR